jgi:hypothetical protein
MMGRYELDPSLAAQLAEAHPAAPAGGPPTGIERRAPNRPWSRARRPAEAAPPASAGVEPRKASNGGDLDWQEF